MEKPNDDHTAVYIPYKQEWKVKLESICHQGPGAKLVLTNAGFRRTYELKSVEHLHRETSCPHCCKGRKDDLQKQLYFPCPKCGVYNPHDHGIYQHPLDSKTVFTPTPTQSPKPNRLECITCGLYHTREEGCKSAVSQVVAILLDAAR